MLKAVLVKAVKLLAWKAGSAQQEVRTIDLLANNWLDTCKFRGESHKCASCVFATRFWENQREFRASEVSCPQNAGAAATGKAGESLVSCLASTQHVHSNPAVSHAQFRHLPLPDISVLLLLFARR